MSILDLPNEVLCNIASNLHWCKDIRAFCLSNRRLHELLLKESIIPRDSRNCHKSSLACVAAASRYDVMSELLDELDADQQKLPDTDIIKGNLRDDHQGHPLLKAGYSLEAIDHIQDALMAAIQAGSEKFVTLLLDRGANARFRVPPDEPEMKERRGPRIAATARFPRDWPPYPGFETWPPYEPPPPPAPFPLNLAIESGNQEMFELLIEKGNAWNCAGPCPVLQAGKLNNRYMVQRLMGRGSCEHHTDVLEEVVKRKDRDMLDFLIQNKINIERHGDTSIFRAISQGDKEMVEFFLDRGANPELLYTIEGMPKPLAPTGPVMWTPIYTAIWFDQIEICEVLIDEGVYPEVEDIELARSKGNHEALALFDTVKDERIPEYEHYSRRWVMVQDEEEWDERQRLENAGGNRLPMWDIDSYVKYRTRR